MMTLLFGIFVLLLFVGVPVAIALSLSVIASILYSGDVPLMIVAQRYFSGINNFSFMSIPLFILAGNIMAEAKISERLTSLAALFFGRFTGGLAHVATGSSAFFGAISGSAPATTAAIGTIMVPAMEKEGYSKEFSSAVVASSGILGNIIPPSLTMVVFGVTASVSIGSLFLSGIVPGIIITVAIIGLNYILSKKKKIPRSAVKVPRAQKIVILKQSFLALLMPLIVLGGIYSSLFTATESAAVACFYGILVGLFFYRTLTWKQLFKIFVDSVESIGMIFFLMGSASLFTYVIARHRLPQIMAESILSITTNRVLILLLMLLIYLFLGTFLDTVGAIILIVPTLLEVIQSANIDLLFFGIFTVISLGIGMITPPVGLNLFVATNISGAKFEKVVRECFPYIALYIALIVLFIFFPNLLTLIKI